MSQECERCFSGCQRALRPDFVHETKGISDDSEEPNSAKYWLFAALLVAYIVGFWL